MFRLGEEQELKVHEIVDFGLYLVEEGDDKTKVLLPKSQCPEGVKAGDVLTVFLYKDSEDRLIATRKQPKLKLHEVGFLKVAQVTRTGAFLDWGLDKDLLLPFKEQPRDHHPAEGESVLAAVYIDKSERLCATMNVYPYLKSGSSYEAGDTVQGIAYETSDNFGVFVAVDGIYSARIPKNELVRPVEIGEEVTARVGRVMKDGRLELSLRAKAAEQMVKDAEVVLARIEKMGGKLPFTDKAPAEVIKAEMNMSKNEFKRAVGNLLKNGRIEIGENSISLRKGRA